MSDDFIKSTHVAVYSVQLKNDIVAAYGYRHRIFPYLWARARHGAYLRDGDLRAVWKHWSNPLSSARGSEPPWSMALSMSDTTGKVQIHTPRTFLCINFNWNKVPFIHDLCTTYWCGYILHLFVTRLWYPMESWRTTIHIFSPRKYTVRCWCNEVWGYGAYSTS